MFSLLDFEDLFGFLMLRKSVSECSGQLSSQELGSFAGTLVKISCESLSFLLVEDGEVSCDIFSDSSDFG